MFIFRETSINSVRLQNRLTGSLFHMLNLIKTNKSIFSIYTRLSLYWLLEHDGCPRSGRCFVYAQLFMEQCRSNNRNTIWLSPRTSHTGSERTCCNSNVLSCDIPTRTAASSSIPLEHVVVPSVEVEREFWQIVKKNKLIEISRTGCIYSYCICVVSHFVFSDRVTYSCVASPCLQVQRD